MIKFKYWAFILLLLILTPLVRAQGDAREDLSQQAVILLPKTIFAR